MIRIDPYDDVYVMVSSDEGIGMELSEFFSFMSPSARFDPRVKNKIWDGRIRLYSPFRKTLYRGLIPLVKKFGEDRGYPVEDNVSDDTEIMSLEKVQKFVDKLDIHSRGEKINVYDYQVEAIYKAINEGRLLIQSPTGSGKSVIAYVVCRILLEAFDDMKILLVVPTTTLVEQFYSDFEDYSSANKWDVEDNVARVYAKYDKANEANIVVSTWQSIYELKKPWFKGFNCIIGDEGHKFKSKSLVGIMERLTNCPYRLGMSGTLGDALVHRLVMQGLFGEVHQTTTTKELQDSGRLSKLNIYGVALTHPQDAKSNYRAHIKQFKTAAEKYRGEIDFLIDSKARNRSIAKIANRCKGNTLVLFRYKKHGQVLKDALTEYSDKPIYYVDGDTDTAYRGKLKTDFGNISNGIGLTSYGTFSTGINIPSIENIVLASPIKGSILVLQTIGRGLRLHEGKTHCNLFDVFDVLSNSGKNFGVTHAKARFDIYNKEKFTFKLIEVDL